MMKKRYIKENKDVLKLINDKSIKIIEIKPIQQTTQMNAFKLMTKEMKEYIATVKRLRRLGQKILDNSYNNIDEENGDSWDQISEVECMEEHLKCCLHFLGIEE